MPSPCSAFHPWHDFDMPKTPPDDRLSNDQPLRSAGQPLPLSEDLIAKLQMAVDKARQQRTSQPASSDHSKHDD
jgi:hypothetical protein